VTQNEIDDLGRRGTVKVFNALTQYADDYEIDEFYEHANMLARLLRILCHPKAIVESTPADERLNRERRRRDRETIARQRTVRISEEAFQYQGSNAAGGHASPKEHHRRAHKRRYAMAGKRRFASAWSIVDTVAFPPCRSTSPSTDAAIPVLRLQPTVCCVSMGGGRDWR
jgi:hypothetical protein